MKTSPPSVSDILEDLSDRPWAYAFLQVCRRLEAQAPHLPRIGEELQPQNEQLRLGQTPATTFAPREIASAAMKHGRLELRLFGLGLHGSSGPLPLHLTEEIHERVLLKRDTTLADFLDMFHHRWISLFYRAWAMGQSAAALDRRHDERFSGYVAALLGHRDSRSTPPAAPRESLGAADAGVPCADTAYASVPCADTAYASVPCHARLAAAGHLVRHARNPAGITATLGQYFGIPVRLEEYAFHWLRLEPEDRIRLGNRETPCTLGGAAVLGRHVPDRQFSVILHAGPLHMEEYRRFLPDGLWHARLVRWIRCFAGLELRWLWSPTLHGEEIPPCRLGRQERLGRTTWLAPRNPEQPVRGRCWQI